MSKVTEEAIPYCYLKYDFSYEGVRHKGKVRLDEDAPGVQMMYDDHDIEITWVKRICHKGKCIELNIVVNDDAYDANEGKVVASAWVCVYDLSDRRKIIDQYEPDSWEYIDECEERNNVSKVTFYDTRT